MINTKARFLFVAAILLAGCSSGTIVKQGEQARQPVIDNWQNIYLYYSPPANYEVIGMITGKGKGFGSQSKMENALEAIKQEALDAGATGVLLQSAGAVAGGSVGTATWSGDSSGGYGVGTSVTMTHAEITGMAIYVPADAAAFTQALAVHQSKCDGLSADKDRMKEAVKAAKSTGTPADVDAAKAKLQAVEDAQDAEFCREDAWYADQMAAQQQLFDKMRAEQAASQDAAKKAAEATHQQECLAAAQKNDLAAWQKLGCQ